MTSLFLLAYLTKRRFGMLGLALCAGSLLSSSWAATLTPLLQQQGFHLISPPLESVVAALLIVTPPVLLLFNGPKNKKPLPRLLAAGLFAFFAFVLLLGPLGGSLLLGGLNQTFYDQITGMNSTLVAVCILIALFDLLLTHPSKKHKGPATH
ncbi:MAG TPA: hypothetical protein VNG90_05400 [Candidatus Acidoferrum sp.]|nr:hypothetical protein [Candidatus Acidoferrum sp.]